MSYFRLWTQGFKCYEQLKSMDDMSSSWSWVEVSKCYEQVRIVDDMNDLGSWTKDYIYYEHLRVVGWHERLRVMSLEL